MPLAPGGHRRWRGACDAQTAQVEDARLAAADAAGRVRPGKGSMFHGVLWDAPASGRMFRPTCAPDTVSGTVSCQFQRRRDLADSRTLARRALKSKAPAPIWRDAPPSAVERRKHCPDPPTLPSVAHRLQTPKAPSPKGRPRNHRGRHPPCPPAVCSRNHDEW